MVTYVIRVDNVKVMHSFYKLFIMYTEISKRAGI